MYYKLAYNAARNYKYLSVETCRFNYKSIVKCAVRVCFRNTECFKIDWCNLSSSLSFNSNTKDIILQINVTTAPVMLLFPVQDINRRDCFGGLNYLHYYPNTFFQ